MTPTRHRITIAGMAERPLPLLRTINGFVVIGTMATYASQAQVSQLVPEQWRTFRAAYPAFDDNAPFVGASPCTDDRKIHYLTGVLEAGSGNRMEGQHLALEAGEYAVVSVDNPASLRETWIWLLSGWLPTSGRREKHAPEFERFTRMSENGTPTGPVEIWIPLEPLTEQ
jgi:AraC family transcriptional regulator